MAFLRRRYDMMRREATKDEWIAFDEEVDAFLAGGPTVPPLDPLTLERVAEAISVVRNDPSSRATNLDRVVELRRALASLSAPTGSAPA